MSIAQNIRELRKKYNMSQEFVAEKLGYKSFTTIQKWESGVSEPPIKKAKVLADLFNIDLDELYGSSIPAAAPQTTPDQEELLKCYDALNEDGQAKVRDYAADLVAGGRYGKDADELSTAYATKDRA